MEHKSSVMGKAKEDSGGQQPHSSSDPAPPPPVPLSIPSLSPLFYRFLFECENLFPFPRSLFAIALARVPSASVRPSFRPLARRRPLALQASGRAETALFVCGVNFTCSENCRLSLWNWSPADSIDTLS